MKCANDPCTAEALGRGEPGTAEHGLCQKCLDEYTAYLNTDEGKTAVAVMEVTLLFAKLDSHAAVGLIITLLDTLHKSHLSKIDTPNGPMPPTVFKLGGMGIHLVVAMPPLGTLALPYLDEALDRMIKDLDGSHFGGMLAPGAKLSVTKRGPDVRAKNPLD
jgi:hypothetical protein